MCKTDVEVQVLKDSMVYDVIHTMAIEKGISDEESFAVLVRIVIPHLESLIREGKMKDEL